LPARSTGSTTTTCQNGEPADVISLEDSNAYEETAYLMASPRNAERLNRATVLEGVIVFPVAGAGVMGGSM
jgi:hypothetical protein